jgi:hypothetical protein
VAGYVIVDQGSIPSRYRTFYFYQRVDIRSFNNNLYTYGRNLTYKIIAFRFQRISMQDMLSVLIASSLTASSYTCVPPVVHGSQLLFAVKEKTLYPHLNNITVHTWVKFVPLTVESAVRSTNINVKHSNTYPDVTNDIDQV